MNYGSAGYLGITKVVKSAAEAVNNSSTLQNDDELKITVQANEVCLIDVLLRMTLYSASDIKWQWTIPSGGTLIEAAAFDSVNFTQEADASAARSDLVASDNEWLLTTRLYYIGGSNAGTIQLTWAQNTAVAHDTIMKANSMLSKLRLK